MSDLTPDELVTRTHDHLNRYITLADNKASILLTAQFAFLGLFANAMRILTIESELVWWCALLGAGSGVIGVFLSGWIVYPKTPKPETGLIFWENIVEYGSVDAFQKSISDLEDGDTREQLVQENYELARVASNKYHYLRWSLRFSGGMLILFTIAAIDYLSF
ncbi:Pycsar system effector family protein [Halorubrum saccharovorum]|uniref:Pycsar system effector family protein n=1 Tax=Halorubrum saccharovorum TaxID=2248 RepID=UPI0012694701|nr:Pycsar system effector family protein [Halorubrum saccharovorum]